MNRLEGLVAATFTPMWTDGSFNFGINVVVGAGLPILKKWLGSIEARIGIGDVPDFRLLAILEF